MQSAMTEATLISGIQDEFDVFIGNQLQGRRIEDIEFIGINFQNWGDVRPIYKCYFSTRESLQIDCPLLSDFHERDMIRALNRITDTAFPEKTRYEIGLKNRNNVNMRWLYQWLRNAFPASDAQAREMGQMAEMSCCDLPEYCHSALYFLGFIADNDHPFPLSAIKLHYLLRNCDDPDDIGMNYRVDSGERLRFLRLSRIAQMSRLSEIIGTLLDSSEGIELWMAAIDFFRNGEAKYKIYVKSVGGNLIAPLKSLLDSLRLEHLSVQLEVYERWLTTHSRQKLYGAAICTTSRGDWSLNLYLTLNA